jgi:MFS family permease
MHDTPAVSPPAAARRHWQLAAAIGGVAVFGLGIGQGAPLISLLLEMRGTDATVNGISAATVSIGIVLGPWLAPRGVRALGINRFLVLCFALNAAGTLAMKHFDSLPAWFVLRFLLGLGGSNIFTASEAWINRLAGDEGRGRVVGLYAASLSVGLGLGPLLLSVTGFRGWTPFLVNAGITALAAIPVLVVGGSAFALEEEGAVSRRAIFRHAPVVFLAVALFGLFEMALMTLLPVWGVRIGLDARHAAAMLSAIYIGAIALQVPLGWLSDRFGRAAVLRLCGAVGLAGAVALLALHLPAAWLFVLLFVWGGVASGIYPVALSMAGDRFPPAQLVAANAALISAYGFGSLAGPALGGVAMDLWNPQGLIGLFVLLFALFVLATSRSRLSKEEADA